jgi:hypothetical protein
MRTLNDYFLTVEINDVSTARIVYTAVPDDGKVIKIQTCIGGTIATSDETITTKINGTAITGGALTITESGSAAGDVDTVYPTGANSVLEGDYLSAETAGDSTNATIFPCMVTFTIRR